MRVVFAGTPAFSAPVLQALLDSEHAVVGVYTQPDRPAGRGRKLTTGPVRQLALRSGIPVFQPVSLRDPQVLEQLAALKPDLMVVVAFGLLLPKAVLDLPRLGCVNLHASLLPRWRGAAPIQRAILAGDRETGICLMQMEAGLDTGPVLAEVHTRIQPRETAGSLHDRLSGLAAELLAAKLSSLEQGNLPAHPQDDTRATYAAKLEKSEALLDWTQTAVQLERQVLAFNPWPVAQTHYHEEVLRVWDAEAIEGQDVAPGTVIATGKTGIDVACGGGGLRLLELQLPGGKRMKAHEFINARPVDGVILG
ncbi:MAG: methionyl-tRNA formyltransferase [Thiogranum sp.]|nr:methionyl-tRNA formyltransferase [Thiogranum sp.]